MVKGTGWAGLPGQDIVTSKNIPAMSNIELAGHVTHLGFLTLVLPLFGGR